MKDAYYFPHDSNARNDPMMMILRAKHGAGGYGNYFMIIEVLRDQEGYRMLSGDLMFKSLALSLGCVPQEVEHLVTDCVALNLLKLDSHLYSPSLIRRMEIMNDLRQKRSVAGASGAAKRWQKHSKVVAVKEVKEVKEEKQQKIAQSKTDGLVSEPEPSIAFPCVGNGHKEWHLTVPKVKEYITAYPGVDIERELRKAKQWCIDNPKKRKTPQGMPGFLSRWLSRQQDRGLSNER